MPRPDAGTAANDGRVVAEEEQARSL